MRPVVPCGVVLVAAVFRSQVANAAPIESVSEVVNGQPVQAVTWTDTAGEPRSVAIRNDTHAIARYTYTVDGAEVVDSELGGFGIGGLVSHCDNAVSGSWTSTSDYSAAAVLQGPHHYVWRSTFLLAMCEPGGGNWRVTNDWIFTTGEDHFIQAVAYDSSDVPANQVMEADMRGPYNQTDWPKGGDISGFGWGTQHKFRTTGPIGDGDANFGGSVAVQWEWTEPNTIPFVWEWCDPQQGAAVDREYGIVQNQPYTEQDFGGGLFGCGADCFASTPPLSGDVLPAAWALPSQMNSYDSNYRSGRITWGGVYGAFDNGHANDAQTIPDMGSHFRPINAWSWLHIIGKYSDGGLQARVEDTEHIYATSMTASVGTVLTAGPRGPGNFVGPTVDSMPTLEWSNPGFDFIGRSWNVAAEQGAAAVQLEVTGGLVRPVLVVHELAGPVASVRVDGVDLIGDDDYFASYDEATQRGLVTLSRTLSAGAHQIAVATMAGEVPPDDGADDDADSGAANDDDDSASDAADDDSVDDGPLGDGGSTASGTAASNSAGGAANTQAEGCGCRQRSTPSRGSFLLLSVLAIGRRRDRRSRARAREACRHER